MINSSSLFIQLSFLRSSNSFMSWLTGALIYIYIERAYANSVVNNDMDRIINIFGRGNGETAILSFKCFLSSYYRFICKNIFTSYVGHC